MRLVAVTHFYNESLLMPSFCMHHKDIFDEVIAIDSGSTDDSADIIRKLCPDWKIVQSKYPDFNAEHNTWECGELETSFGQAPDLWKVALNTTEYIWHPEFRTWLENASKEAPEVDAFGMRSFCLVDHPNQSGLDGYYYVPFYFGKTWGYLDEDQSYGFNVSRRRRFVHRGLDGQYDVGRHSTRLKAQNVEDAHILHASYSPWPFAVERKLQIQTRMPDSDKQMGRGVQHMVDRGELNRKYLQHLGVSKQLSGYPSFSAAHRYFTHKFFSDHYDFEF